MATVEYVINTLRQNQLERTPELLRIAFMIMDKLITAYPSDLCELPDEISWFVTALIPFLNNPTLNELNCHLTNNITFRPRYYVIENGISGRI